MECERREVRGWRNISGSTARRILAISGAVSLSLPSILFATHEADHRFTVEGFVCDKDGKPNAQVEVLVKDTRVTIGQTVRTDGDGYYKVTLHLHNDNFGDPLLVEAGTEQKAHNQLQEMRSAGPRVHGRALTDRRGSGKRNLHPGTWFVRRGSGRASDSQFVAFSSREPLVRWNML